MCRAGKTKAQHRKEQLVFPLTQCLSCQAGANPYHTKNNSESFTTPLPYHLYLKSLCAAGAVQIPRKENMYL